MLKSIWSALFPLSPPQQKSWPVLLSEAGSKSYSGFPFDDNKQPACFRARAALHDFYDADCPVRSYFRSVIRETAAGTSDINLQDITGCGNSKTATEFSRMARIGWFRKETAEKAQTREDMAEKVFNGASDCVRRKGEKARITRQLWDGRMWFGNDGGSHRASAIWLLDRAESRQRLVSCDIIDMDVSPDFESLCRDYSIFLFTPEHCRDLMEKIRETNGGDIIVSAGIHKYSSQQPDLCLIVRKNHSDHAAVKSALGGAFDFSDWALAPETFEKPEPEIVPLEIRAAAQALSL